MFVPVKAEVKEHNLALSIEMAAGNGLAKRRSARTSGDGMIYCAGWKVLKSERILRDVS